MTSARIPLFSLLGFRINVDWSWFFVAGLWVITLSTWYFPHVLPSLELVPHILLVILGMAGLFISLILHELAHVITARRFGLPVGNITLFIFGGVPEIRQEPPSPRAEFWIAIAGPLASIFVAIIVHLIVNLTKIRAFLALGAFIEYANALFALLNLVPAFPLDGGRMLRAILWWRTGNLRYATRIAAAIGFGFGTLLIFLGFYQIVTLHIITGIWFFIIGFFVAITASQAKNQTNICQSLIGVSVNDLMNKTPLTVSPDVTIDVLLRDYIYHHSRKFVVVTDHNDALGYISPKEIKQVAENQWPETYARAIMALFTHDTVASADTPAIDALRKLQANGIGHIAILDGKKIIGTLTDIDFANYLSVREELTASGNINKPRLC